MAIEVTNPTSVSEWKKETEYTITWTGEIADVIVKLYKNSVFIEDIALVVGLGDGSYAWTPSTGLTTGNDYQVYVDDTTTNDYSDNFLIYSAFVVQLSDTLGLDDSLAKKPTKVLTDDLTLSDSIVKKPTKVLTDDLTLSDSIVKKPTKVLTDDLTLSDSIVKKPTKVLTDDLTLSDSITVSVVRLSNSMFFSYNF